MRKCIICNLDKEDDSFNEEHVIPLILGNKTFTIQNVCTCCNSLMGEKIIAPFSTSDFIVTFRKRHDLRGHSRKVPAYKHLVTYKDGIKAVRNQSGEIEIGPQVLEDKDGFSIIGSNFQKMKEIADNKAKKAGKKWAYKIEERILEGFSFPTGIDYHFILAAIVVCYERHGQALANISSVVYHFPSSTFEIISGKKNEITPSSEGKPLDPYSTCSGILFDEFIDRKTLFFDGLSCLLYQGICEKLEFKLDQLHIGSNRFAPGLLLLR